MSNLYPKHSLYNMQVLAKKLTVGLPTEVEQFRAIYKWVATNIENDYTYFLKNQRKRKKYLNKPEKLKAWNNEFTVMVFKKLLKEHQTVCTGYAALIRELASAINLEVIIVNGYSKTPANSLLTKGVPNHSWNAIKLDGKWYLCDPTWSAGRIYTDSRGFQFEYFDGYFLTNPQLFALNHLSLEVKWALSDSIQGLEEFMERPIVYRGAIEHQLLLEKPAKLKQIIQKGDTLHFQLKQLNRTAGQLDLSLKINKASTTVETIGDFKSHGSDIYILDYVWERKGTYILHLKLGEQYLYSLEVKVD